MVGQSVESVRVHIHKLLARDHGHSTESLKTECLQQHSKGGGEIKHTKVWNDDAEVIYKHDEKIKAYEETT